MRIQTNISAMLAHRNLSQTNSAMQGTMSRLSSGFRIVRAGDDAAGLSIANKLRAETRSLQAASRNAEQAGSVLQIAESSTTSISSILTRMKELATQAASSNNSGADALASLDAEYDALVAEMDRIVDSTKYQGSTLIDGTFTGTFQVGSSNAASDQLSVALSNLDTATLGVAADDISTTTGAQTALGLIDTAIGTVNTALGNIGALQNRLDYAQSNIKAAIQNFSAAESVIRDADMAEEMTTFTKQQILAQAGTAMLAQANQLPQNVLQLLRG